MIVTDLISSYLLYILRFIRGISESDQLSICNQCACLDTLARDELIAELKPSASRASPRKKKDNPKSFKYSCFWIFWNSYFFPPLNGVPEKEKACLSMITTTKSHNNSHDY